MEGGEVLWPLQASRQWMAAETRVVAVEMVGSSWTKGISWSCNLHSVMSNWEWKRRERKVSRIPRSLA